MESSSVGAASVEICRSYGVDDFWSGRFYKYAAPTALGCIRPPSARICEPPKAAAYAAVEQIHFDGAHFHRDIATKAF